MKITCPFCKTDYTADVPNGRSAECTVCSHSWRPARRSGVARSLAIAFVLVAIAFAGALAIKYMPKGKPQEPLVIEMVNIRPIETGFSVSGRIRNISGQIYGVPDIVLVVKNRDDEIILRHRMRPPLPILDIGEAAEFNNEVPEFPDGAKRVIVEFRK